MMTVLVVVVTIIESLSAGTFLSQRRSIFRAREWTGSKTVFLARIFNLSSVCITATDARRVKRREN